MFFESSVCQRAILASVSCRVRLASHQRVARVGFTTATLVLEADRAGINQSTPLEPYDVCFAEKHSGTRHKKSTCNTKKKVIFLEALAS
jgi:hypothetical protein